MPPDRQTYMAHASCPDDTFNFAWMMVSYLLPFSGSTKKKEGGKQKIKRRKKKLKGPGWPRGNLHRSTSNHFFDLYMYVYVYARNGKKSLHLVVVDWVHPCRYADGLGLLGLDGLGCC
jgi:hypothetical protein